MAEKTKIEWADSTFNPVIGCTKVSPACDHCYAEVSAPARVHGIVWGAKAERIRTKPGTWSLPLRWNAQHEAFFNQHGRRQRVFCASLSDVFDNAWPVEWRRDLFELVLKCDKLDWLLLTKRVGNVASMVPPEWLQPGGWPKHVRIGATVASQDEADRDIPKLLALPCPNFLSMEPLLGPVNLPGLFYYGTESSGGIVPLREKGHTQIDWVIVGGESGHAARPMHPAWVRSLRDQCAEAGTPFLFKQWGEWTPGENVERVRGTVETAFLQEEGWLIKPLNLATDEGHIDDQPDLYNIGKKAAGRLLDGVEHNGYPVA